MAMPTRYSTFLNESLQKQQNIIPICRYLKAEDIYGAISAAIFLLAGTDIDFWLKVKLFIQMLTWYIKFYR